LKTLHIDFETFSSVDIRKAGAYPYTNSPDFEILLMGYAFDDEPVKVLDFTAGEGMSELLKAAILDPGIKKKAHNANFERLCLRAYGIETPSEFWECSAVLTSYCGLPLALGQAAKALKLAQEKDTAGTALINFFCVPAKPSKRNNFKTRNFPEDDPEKWAAFVNYCRVDVEVEREICEALKAYKIPQFEVENYHIDQKINDRGVLVDLALAEKCIEINAETMAVIIARLKKLTGLENPNSPAQLAKWLSLHTEKDIKKVGKEDLKELLADYASGTIREVIKLRLKAAKTSITKYQAGVNCTGTDGRARGLFRFYGAGRTGRWAGRLVQVQNLPRNKMDDLDLARRVCSVGDADLLGILFADIQSVLSQLIRTMFVPKPGTVFAIADFSAIEARVIAWLAGEKWRLDVFNSHGKIYEASAALMFGIPLESIGKGSPERDKGKVAELALGYGGGVGALKQMGGESMGLDDSEMKTIVSKWRRASPKIVDFWDDLNSRALDACEHIGTEFKDKTGRISFRHDGKILAVRLPSGRSLHYQKAFIKDNRFGRPGVFYWGVDSISKQWKVLDIYGGKIAENITQAVARDLLAFSLLNLENAGFPVVMHIHDEAVVELLKKGAEFKFAEIIEILAIAPGWAKGLPLGADGFLSDYYKKD
jgi:DNA polymerase